ncbi:hypothetical protein OIU34_09995 [Pararhizobium sp. BT-229]|uniref:hypothetical protein n=1 Tax=Pararhizobium sp. BT-229 TaxID=2986923 RepID=UPI0021F7C057|nr:hypothetical protein [Pararhizobium sp. BT-229]MCV9962230.1 hypothetical protein [Pararhizobium sp. BT-229]
MTVMSVQTSTVLDKATPADVTLDPYPYLVVRNALPSDYYAKLSETFPDLTNVPAAHATANNKRLDLMSSWGKALRSGEEIPAVWQQFMSDHSTPAFARRVFGLFPSMTVPGADPDTRWLRTEAYGDGLADKLGLTGPVADTDIVGRVTLGVNTPVTERVSVRGPHVDSPRKAYVGLLYVRHPDDKSEGGDLAVYRWKAGARRDPWTAKANPDDVEQVGLVKYEPNTFVIMLSAYHSLHGVTEREPTPYLRRLAICSGWFPGVDQSNFVRGDLAKMS